MCIRDSSRAVILSWRKGSPAPVTSILPGILLVILTFLCRWRISVSLACGFFQERTRNQTLKPLPRLVGPIVGLQQELEYIDLI